MIFGEEKDWKEFMCGEAQAELASLIEKAKKHRCAYMQADDVKVAQVWCALAEINSEIKAIVSKLIKLENAVKGISAMGEIAKRQTLEEKVKDLFKANTEKEKEQIDKIVDALMEF